jgi:hypothetical protein
MTIANKLGPSYEAVRAQARIKTITVTLNDVECELKVRIPVKREMDEINTKITQGDSTIVDRIYTELSAPLLKTINEADEGFIKALGENDQKIVVTKNDVNINGTSFRQIASLTALWQTQVQIYFSLLQTPTGEPVNESYDEIAEEFPEQIIREIVQKIDAVIKPNYKDTKKN